MQENTIAWVMSATRGVLGTDLQESELQMCTTDILMHS